MTTARHKAIDRSRRESTRHSRQSEAHRLIHPETHTDRSTPEDHWEEGEVHDDQLRLIFTCCHPSLALNAQVALTLRLLGGMETPEIARAFLVSDATIAQRIVRAKRKIREARIPYRVPGPAEIPERLDAVLAVVYLVFNEGYTASGGDALSRDDLCNEAIRLSRLLAELMPEESEALGLLALLLLTASRRHARTAEDGTMIVLAEQDRSLWDPNLIAEGRAIAAACVRRGRPGPYQLQATIAAVHSESVDAASTNWPQIVRIYDHLMAIAPSPVVALNRAVAVAEVDGPQAALSEIAELPLGSYHLWWATRGELLSRLGRRADAADSFARAIQLTSNNAEVTHLRFRMAALR